ncbi:hypothetical protein HK098_000018 [Nowakowskiella sp. JEL0407]|nr:hypothetical protein HK098_000018 [Nowakowskiella sp. JEL0407]
MASRDSPFPLFGGAVESLIPSSFIDASDLREIPDNQEVFIDTLTNESLIFEILELEEDIPNEQAASFHFQQLASDNDASDESEIISIEYLRPGIDLTHMQNDAHLTYLFGRQKIAKYRDTDPLARNVVNIYLICIRLFSVQTDFIITYNHPIAFGPASREIAGVWSSSENDAVEKFRASVQSFEIKDWTLFQN